MGANFFYSICRWPSDEQGQIIAHSPRLAEIITERVSEAIKQGDDDELDCYVGFDETESDEQWRQKVINRIKPFIDQTFGLGQYRRDMAPLSLDGKEYIITGEMSWGDISDTMEHLSLLDSLGVTDQVINSDLLKNPQEGEDNEQ